MKGYLLPTAVLLGIFAFVLWNNTLIASHSARWQTQLEQCQTLAQEERWAEAAQALQDSFRDWRRYQTYLHIVCMHSLVDDAEAMYFRAAAFIRTQEISELSAELSQLRCQFQLLTEKEQISFGNIL